MYYEYELQMSRQKMAETLEDSAQLKTKCKQALDENCLLIKEQ